MSGLYFEEFEPGQVFKHAIARTITETDNLIFCALTHNAQPLHLDAEFAKGTEFGQRIVNSIFTLGLMIGVSVGDTTLGTTIANLGMADTRFAHPVFIGDTLRAETTVAEKRESRHAQDFCRSAAEQHLFRLYLVQLGDTFRQRRVFHAWVTVRTPDRRLYGVGHFQRRTIHIFIAVQSNKAVILLESGGLECVGS